MASLVAGAVCRQARSIGRLQTLNQNHFASQSNFIVNLRHFATKKMSLPRVFFDMTIDGEKAGRFIVEVSTNKFNFFHFIISFFSLLVRCYFVSFSSLFRELLLG